MTHTHDAPTPPPLVRLWQRARPVAMVAWFFAGVIWYAVTLTRIDRLRDNAVLAGYLATLAVLIAVEQQVESWPERWPRLARRYAWISAAVQFLFGSLWTAYLVFYTRSASWGPSAAFVVALATVVVANELLHRRLRARWLRVAMLSAVTWAFLLFFVPVVSGWYNEHLGLIALAGSVALSSLVTVAATWGLDAASAQRGRHVVVAVGVAALLAGVERAGLVPPVPLAALEIGVFHGVETRPDPDTPSGRSRRVWLSYDDPGPWRRLWTDDDATFRWRPGDSAWCFTAVFVPTGMAMHLWHRWQRWDPAQGWVDTDRIDVSRSGSFEGGAERGFRTWSRKHALTEGAWRVLVEDDRGREIARTRFDVVPTKTPPTERLQRSWE
jgi:hypothetical protein